MDRKIIDEIVKLKEKRNAVILAHNYQRPEIQDMADFIGDSFGLSKKAAETDASVIVFCGVDFMAETASILNPGRTVLIPDTNAQCPLAQMLFTEELLEAKKRHPKADVVLYINTLAKHKAYADCICTSGNAVKIIDAMDSDTILFGPDVNLAKYVEKRTKKKIIPVPEHGICLTHHKILLEDVLEAKKQHPNAKLVVHPETKPEIQDIADCVASTEGILNYCRESSAKEFIIGTENGMLYRLGKELPDKKFYQASKWAVCPNMKLHTLQKVRDSLKDMKYVVKVPDDVASKARKPIQRMMDLSQP